jgi:hypothetical protein
VGLRNLAVISNLIQSLLKKGANPKALDSG